ncbi:ShlB/FhaC/HecB family hemolysin secretion/activation protein [Pseudomonas sp.]|uniref:ShlB/FhaC/HecB family hemolysin secretion/activation protein n=1 Tax=Pseudomonas sp. TaxID=306 RepID=UPI003CC626FB
MNRLIRTSLLACSTLLAPLAQADDTLRWLDQQQRERETLDREQRLRQLQRALPPAPSAPGALATDTRCWQLPGLHLRGNRLVSDNNLQAAISPHVRPCMGVNALRQVLTRITRVYVERGYIAARAYPAQPPVDGQPLAIVIDEGFVEAIELDDEQLPVWLQGAFPDLLGNPLHLPALEQGLDQLNRLRSVDVEAQIVPGDLEGGSRILLSARSHASPWGARVRYGNGGDLSSGRHGASLVISRDNPLHLNDRLQVSLFSSAGNAPHYSRALSAYYSVPYGPWTLGASLGRSQQVAFTPVGRKRYAYTSDSQGLSLGRTLWRNQRALLHSQLRLNRKHQQRSFDGQRMALPDARQTSAGIDLSLLWLGRATWSTQLGYGRSLPWLGSDSRAFDHWRLGVIRTQVWPGNGHQWRWDSSLEAQYSPKPLPAGEQVLLSNSASVHGFRDSNIAASSAAVWRNSVALALPISPALRLTPHVAVDYGRGWGTWTHDRQHPVVAGISTGASLGWAGGEVTLDYRHAVVIKDGPPAEPGFWNMELKLDF